MSIALERETETRLPDRYELIDGEIVEVRPMSGLAASIANRINKALTIYGDSSGLGSSFMDTLFRVPLPRDRSRNRRPDVAFVTFDRLPEDQPLPYRGISIDVVPDLFVEVASPSDEADELLSKAYEFLRAGARLVWLVYPRTKTLYAYESPTKPRIFAETDELDGGTVLPGFRVPMARLFPPMIDEEAGDE